MAEAREQLRVGGITDMSTVDWYGNVSLVLFFAGCNIRCPYCQNSELIPFDSGMLVGLDYLKERIEMSMDPVPQLDAVVFTGGELTKRFLRWELERSRERLENKCELKGKLHIYRTGGKRKTIRCIAIRKPITDYP